MAKKSKEQRKHLKPAKSKRAAKGDRPSPAGKIAKPKRSKQQLPRADADAPRVRVVPGKKRKKKSAALNVVSAMRDSLEELLAAGEGAARAAPEQLSAKSNKKRQQLVSEETQQMQEIMQHPAFVADPFAALQEHLRNTVQTQPRNAATGDDRRPRAKGGKKRR